MPATDFDSAWFHSNPDRAYRLRRQTPGEVAQWAVPPGSSVTAWCIIRRTDGALEAFGLPDDDTWDDHDEELAEFFETLRGSAA